MRAGGGATALLPAVASGPIVLDTIYCADVLDYLRALPDESVNCVVTSPPYFALRSYLPANHPDKAREIGSEPTPAAFVATMVAVFREVRRVLRRDGVCWLNIAGSYSSGIIETDEYVMREDLTSGEIARVFRGLAQRFNEKAQALSGMRSADGQAEQDLSGLPQKQDSQATKLRDENLPEVRQGVRHSQSADDARTGKVLLPLMREVGQPDAQEVKPHGQVSDVRENVQQVSGGNQEEQRQTPLLQPGVLVQLQPTGQSLSLDGRPGRADESRWREVAQTGDETGQTSLPNLSRKQAIGSASYLSVRTIPGETLGSQQRDHAVPRLSREVQTSRIGICRTPVEDCSNPGRGLESLKLHKADIPPDILRFFRPFDVIKPKDEIDIPAMLSEALRRDGWYKRSTIIWAKPNPMPESVGDRPTKSHEYLFLLTKSPSYWYDAEAIREPLTQAAIDRDATPRGRRQNGGGSMESLTGIKYTTALGDMKNNPAGRNARSVWTIATEPTPFAHFATFPSKLVERCVLAGCPDRVCATCGAPWERCIVPTGHVNRREPAHVPGNSTTKVDSTGWAYTRRATNEWRPTCACNATTRAGVVLDPFMGSGTSALVSRRLGRHYVGCDLNPAYVALAKSRLAVAYTPPLPLDAPPPTGAACVQAMLPL